MLDLDSHSCQMVRITTCCNSWSYDEFMIIGAIGSMLRVVFGVLFGVLKKYSIQ